MRKGYWLLIVLLACLTGCVPVDALNPFYTDKNVIFDPGLAGTWVGSNPEEGSLRFIRTTEDAYQMIITERTSSGDLEESIYSAHLISLGGEKYLDVTGGHLPNQTQTSLFSMNASKKGAKFEPALREVGGGFYLEVLGPTPGKGGTQELQVKLHPAHWILKIVLSEKTLSLSFLDREWVAEQIRKRLIQAEHLKADDQAWVLSGSTAELQQFVVQHADDPGAFDGAGVLTKVEAAKPEDGKSENAK